MQPQHTLVHVNGLMLVPGIDYSISSGLISFTQPPPAFADISIIQPIHGTAGGHFIKHRGNGSTFLFPLDTDFDRRAELESLLEDARKYQDQPTVADALQRLKVIIELVKQD